MTPTTVTVTDIIAGEAAVSWGTDGSEADLGSTVDGVSIREEVEWYDITIDQSVGVVRKVLVSRKIFVTFALAEASLDHLRLGMNLASSSLANSSLTIEDTEEGEKSLVVESIGEGQSARNAKFPKCIITGSTEHAYKKNDTTLVPYECEAVCDPANSDRFGYIYDA